MGFPTAEKWVLTLTASTLLAATMSSLSITVSTVTRDFNLQAAIRSLIYFMFFFVSNLFYPEKALQARLGSAAPIAYYSPVSMTVSIYRYCFGYLQSVDLFFNLAGLTAWCLISVLLAYRLYIRNLTR